MKIVARLLRGDLVWAGKWRGPGRGAVGGEQKKNPDATLGGAFVRGDTAAVLLIAA